MAQKKKLFQNIQVIIRPAPKKLKIVFTVLVLLCVTALVALGVVYGQIVTRTRNLQEAAATLTAENADLVEKTDSLGTPGSVREIAREELGLADPDTVLIDPNSH